MENSKLIRRAVDGDADAFGKLYEIYASELFRYACYVLGSAETAEDAVQDTVLSAFRQVTSLKKEASFKAWLFKILSVTCRGYINEKVRQRSVVALDEITERDGGYLSDVSADLSPEIALALQKLTQEERSIVILSLLYNYKSREIADILEMTAGTVRSKLSRALDKMKTIMEQEVSG